MGAHHARSLTNVLAGEPRAVTISVLEGNDRSLATSDASGPGETAR